VITYTITITNTGDVTLENITVFDSLLGNLSHYFADSLAPGASENHNFTYIIKKCDTSPLVNEVVVRGIAPGCAKAITDTASASVRWYSYSQTCRSPCKEECGFWYDYCGTTCSSTKR
jgi:uncharacterized repeat protein (TIGR01451 family)